MAKVKLNDNSFQIGDAQIYIKSSQDMSDIIDGSVNLVITSPPYWTLKDYENDAQIGTGSTSYEAYIEELNKVWKECIRVLSPDGKLCINIMPFLLTGKAARFERRETRLVLDDISRFMFETNEMYQFGLFIWDKRKIVRFSLIRITPDRRMLQKFIYIFRGKGGGSTD